MKTMMQHLAKDYDIDDGVYFSKKVLVGDRGAEMSALQARQMVRDSLDDGSFKTPPEIPRTASGFPTRPDFMSMSGLSPRHDPGRPRQGDLPPRACQQRVEALGRPRRDGVVRDRE
jgi:Cyclic GMP-AMP synthase DncV-like, nucleotidyltransferase domain